MESKYKPVAHNFRQVIEALVAQRKYVGIHYIADIQELLTTTAIIKKISATNEVEVVELSTGEEIRLDKLVRVDNNVSPNYPGYNFSYHCAL